MPYIVVNGVQVWENWTSTYLGSALNSSDPIGALVTGVGHAIPYFWPVFSFFLYLFMLFIFKETPPRYKWPAITLIVAAINIVLAFSGYLPEAIFSVVAFGLALFASRFFNL